MASKDNIEPQDGLNQDEKKLKTKSGLDILGLPGVFSTISDNAQTGTLLVQYKKETKYIYFREGKIQQVSSPQKASFLDEALRRHPQIDDDTYRLLCEKQKETGQSLSSILLSDESGVEMATVVCLYQITEDISEIFTWPEVHCEFSEESPSPLIFDLQLLEIPIDMNANAVIMEAARRFDEWGLIHQVLPSNRDIPYITDACVKEELEENENTLCSLINGVRDIEEILEDIHLSPFLTMQSLSKMIQEQKVALKTGKELLQMAALDIFRKDPAKCIKLYERAESLGESSVETISWLATSYETMGLKDKAAEKYYQLGAMYIERGRSNGAIVAFTKVTQLTPENLEAHEKLIGLLCVTEQLEEAASKLSIYARRLTMEGKLKEAINVLEKAEDQGTLNAENMYLLAGFYYEEGKRDKALKTYEMLADYLCRSEALDEAVKVYTKLLIIDRDNYKARMSLANCLSSMSRYDEALSEYKDLGSLLYSSEAYKDPSWGDLLARTCNIIIKYEQNNIEARKWLTDVCIETQAKEKAIILLHEILSLTDDLEIHVESLKNLVQLEPNVLDHREKLADAYIKLSKYREAAQEYFSLGMAAANTGVNQLAKEAFNRLLALEPSNLPGRIKKVEILMQEKDRKEAREEAVGELKLIGYLGRSTDKAWHAVRAFTQLLALEPDGELGCYLELGKLFQRLGENEKALASYQKYIEKSVRQENFGDAFRTCDTVLSISPDNNWASTLKKKIQSVLELVHKELRARKGDTEIQKAGSQVQKPGSEILKAGSQVQKPGSDILKAGSPAQKPGPEVPAGTPSLGLNLDLTQMPGPVPTQLRLDPFLKNETPPPPAQPTQSTPPPGLGESSPFAGLRLDPKLTEPVIPQLSLDSALQPIGSSPLHVPTPPPPSHGLELQIDPAILTPPVGGGGLRIDPSLAEPGKVKMPSITSEKSSQQILFPQGQGENYLPPIELLGPSRDRRGAALRKKSSPYPLIFIVITAIAISGYFLLFSGNKPKEKVTRNEPAKNSPEPTKVDQTKTTPPPVEKGDTVYDKYEKAVDLIKVDPNKAISILDEISKSSELSSNQELKKKIQEKKEAAIKEKERIDIVFKVQKADNLVVEGKFDEAFKYIESLKNEIKNLDEKTVEKVNEVESRLDIESKKKYDTDVKKIQKVLKENGTEEALKLFDQASQNQTLKWKKELDTEKKRIENIQYREKLDILYKKTLDGFGNELRECFESEKTDYDKVSDVLTRIIKGLDNTDLIKQIEELKTNLATEKKILEDFISQLESLRKERKTVKINYSIKDDPPREETVKVLFVNRATGGIFLQEEKTNRSFSIALTDLSPQCVISLFQTFFKLQGEEFFQKCGLLMVRLGNIDEAHELFSKLQETEQRNFRERLAWGLYIKAFQGIQEKRWKLSRSSFQKLATDFSKSSFVSNGGIRGGESLYKKAAELMKEGKKNKTKYEEARQILLLIVSFYEPGAIKDNSKNLLEKFND